MLRMDLQFFAHKKVWVLPRTVEIPNPKDWAQREQTDSL